MTVRIMVYHYTEVPILKRLFTELKNRKPISIKKDVFGALVELNVNSFDEIISLLEKYNPQINIELSIDSINEVSVYIHNKTPWCGLDEQVE